MSGQLNLRALRAVCDAATAGCLRRRPTVNGLTNLVDGWTVGFESSVGWVAVASFEREEDADHYLEARTAMPALLDEVERLREALADVLDNMPPRNVRIVREEPLGVVASLEWSEARIRAALPSPEPAE